MGLDGHGPRFPGREKVMTKHKMEQKWRWAEQGWDKMELGDSIPIVLYTV